MELLEDDAEAFERLLNFLYTGQFDVSPIGDYRATRDRYFQLVQLYILGDKYVIPILKNGVMALLFDTIKSPDGSVRTDHTDDHDDRVSKSIVRLVYANTFKGSPLRKFMTAFFAWHYDLNNESFWERFSNEPEITRDMALCLAQRVGGHSYPFDDINNFLVPVPDHKVSEA
ncbi:MAG: hypothetical protein Q9168_004784 [Polycauliona sp. 1 TL-2023]